MSTQPDFAPESRLVEVPAAEIVAMRSASANYVDQGGHLGLGVGDLINLRLPSFQRGLKWDVEKLRSFHASLLQGWPVGVMVMAVERSQILNSATGQRSYELSLIDGQQRSWALAQLTRSFWQKPWFTFSNPKWEPGGTAPEDASGSVAEASRALNLLADEVGVSVAELEAQIQSISVESGEQAFVDYMTAFELLTAKYPERDISGTTARGHVRLLCEALIKQRDELASVRIPVLVIGENLQSQLPVIFRRLNEGVPLKGYDLLAAQWESERLSPQSPAPGRLKTLLDQILSVASGRIQDSYELIESGYEVDPNQEPLRYDNLSLFDLLYFLSKEMAKHDTFAANDSVFAFQVAALSFRGAINRVDDNLSRSFPATESLPATERVSGYFLAATADIVAALKPMMDVSPNNLTVKGRVGLTQGVVYASALLALHNRVQLQDNGRMTIRSRQGSAEDRLASPGTYLTATARQALLKRNLPAWFVHDSLTSVFAGSRAYQAASDRVWNKFGSTISPEPSDEMLKRPSLDSLSQAFRDLWDSEMDVDRTPMRRRISDGGSVLLRAVYLNDNVHDIQIDHVLPISKGRASSASLGVAFPMNHVANLLPIDSDINGKRGDEDWPAFVERLNGEQRSRSLSLLLVESDNCGSSRLQSLDEFTSFLRSRYKAMVERALSNIANEEWMALSDENRTLVLGIASGE